MFVDKLLQKLTVWSPGLAGRERVSSGREHTSSKQNSSGVRVGVAFVSTPCVGSFFGDKLASSIADKMLLSLENFSSVTPTPTPTTPTVVESTSTWSSVFITITGSFLGVVSVFILLEDRSFLPDISVCVTVLFLPAKRIQIIARNPLRNQLKDNRVRVFW